MSATSINNAFETPRGGPEDRDAADKAVMHREWKPQLPAIANWRRPFLEILLLVVVIAIWRSRSVDIADFPGLPHPYWLVVLLASCQYGTTGGLIATIMACFPYWFERELPSATQDFYSYAGAVAVQPAAWLATALVLGGLRNLHMHQQKQLARQLSVSRRQAGDLGKGLSQATAEINALERRIAVDVGTVSALVRQLAVVEMSNRRAAAASFGEIFRIAAGVSECTIYLRDRGAYRAVWSARAEVLRTIDAVPPLDLTNPGGIQNDADIKAIDVTRDADVDFDRQMIRVAPTQDGCGPLALITYEASALADVAQFRRRAADLGQAFARLLRACPDVAPGAQP
ncbi:MAG: hypothetical protein JWQ94_4363 [Tardiphaga sp.]|nr:hypothetical protein [Tardiphaga sp.]